MRKGWLMPKYLVSGKYTLTGLGGLRSAGAKSRVDAVTSLIEAMGGRLESFHFAFGDADVLVIVDLPDDESVAALAVTINSSGAVTVRTTKLLTADQVDQALQRQVDYRPPGS